MSAENQFSIWKQPQKINEKMVLGVINRLNQSMGEGKLETESLGIYESATIYMQTPKYQTAYACEGKRLTIECEPGDLINLIRANYGRFSITICNDHGNVEWSVNCMFPKSLTVLNSRCAHKQSCSVQATTDMFGDPCPGTHKYLEAHYQCISASQTSTTTNRPSPPWVLTGNGNTPPILANSTTFFNPAIATGTGTVGKQPPARLPLPGVGPGIIPGSNSVVPGIWNTVPSSSSSGPPQLPTINPTLPGGRIKGGFTATTSKMPNRHHDGFPQQPPPSQQHHHQHHQGHHNAANPNAANGNGNGTPQDKDYKTGINNTTPSNTRILTGVGGSGSDDATLLTTKSSTQQHHGKQQSTVTTVPSNNIGASDHGGVSGMASGTRTINNINNANAGLNAKEHEEANMFCGPTNARNLFWNMTRVGDVNVQPCPGGATGIAKWRCVLMKRITDAGSDDDTYSNEISSKTLANKNCINNSNCKAAEQASLENRLKQRLRGFEPTWHPATPDLTQCRSLWLNSLEVRVNQRDSSLISIANDLSEVTSSKTLYGGDMLVTTKIIQTMSDKMFHDKETFPDQRQREAIILELLHGVVKTGSNLLDETQLPSWLDLNQEDQMRVATSLLTGLEYNAFLLADTIIRERNVEKKVKNILLAVRVLETKNIQSNVVFPDAEQWPISDDRIELPRAALLENSEGGLVRIVFAAFDRLESILKPTYDYFDLKSSRSYVRNTAILNNDSSTTNMLQRMRILNSKVISASLGKGRHIQLSQPIKLVLKHLKTENVTNPTCVFWNYIDHAWSANGCNLESTNRTHSICMCNHLTNFALLMDVMDEHNSALFSMFDGNMRILIYISIGICIVFIIIALLTLKIFNGVVIKSARTSIYRNIYICLLLTEILFLLGIEQSESSIFCGFTAVFVHCAILSAIAWFCFEAFQSYTTLTTDDMLLEVDQTAKVNCYYLLSYALSISIVAISLAINPSSYTRNDYCVLIEGNMLFYTTFLAPLLLFFLGAVCYTILASVLMCRKSRSALKNKEHTRLSNVRFDIRCSFIFLLILSATWSFAYFYLRQSKLDDQMAIVYGYLFISCNTLMGFYIFIFHCIQNEKIRREYRKYVRKNAWLPKCLRCSKTSISSGIGVGGISAAGIAAGTISSNTVGSSSGGVGVGVGVGANSQLKKTKLQLSDENVDVDDAVSIGIIAADTDDAILASSDCELNETQSRRGCQTSNANANVVKSGVIQGSLVPQQHQSQQQQQQVQQQQHSKAATANSMTAIAMAQSSSGGTLRSQKGGGHTPSAGHASPTSSVGSTHLIFGHGHKQQIASSTPFTSNPANTHEAYYHHPEHGWKQQQQGQGGGIAMPPPNARDFHNNLSNNIAQHAAAQPHEFFYWTQKHGSGTKHNKKKRTNGLAGGGTESPSGSLQSRATAASQIIFYPSYKKTTYKNPQQYAHYSEAIEPTTAFYQQQQQHQRRYPSVGHQPPSANPNYQQYLSSDDEPPEAAAAHAHLLHLSRRAAQQQLPPLPHHNQYPPAGEFAGPPHAAPQRYYRNKQSNCDLSQDYLGDAAGHDAGDTYYNQDSLGSSDNGPVYEEILSNRNSDSQHYGIGEDCDDFEYNRQQQHKQQQQQQQRLRNNGTGGSKASTRNCIGKSRSGHLRRNNGIKDDDFDHEPDDDESVCDEDDDDDDDDNDVSSMHGFQQSDERMRRLMALQDEDFQRRFQRQQRKNAAAAAAVASAQSYYDYDGQQAAAAAAALGFNGAAGTGSVRSFKKTSPNNRMAVNELFINHGPPLPPANVHPLQKRQQSQQQAQPQQQQPQAQQQQQQQLSPQSTASSSASATSSSVNVQQKQQATRNISAMLDENNTVRCYLEPLNK